MELNAAGYHVIEPVICSQFCKCGKRCERYLNHAVKAHCCMEHLDRQAVPSSRRVDQMGDSKRLSGQDYN